MFQIHIVVDIKSDKAIQLSELNDVIIKALDNHRLSEGVTIKKDKFFELVAIEGKCSLLNAFENEFPTKNVDFFSF